MLLDELNFITASKIFLQMKKYKYIFYFVKTPMRIFNVIALIKVKTASLFLIKITEHYPNIVDGDNSYDYNEWGAETEISATKASRQYQVQSSPRSTWQPAIFLLCSETQQKDSCDPNDFPLWLVIIYSSLRWILLNLSLSDTRNFEEN